MPSTESQPPPGAHGPSETQPVTAPQSSWAYPVMWMVVCLILVSAGLYVFKSCRDLPGEALDKMERVAAAFNRGTVTTSFISTATTMSGSQYLQIATLSQQEIFTETNEASTGFGYVPLPDVVIEASAPVTYTYYLDLNSKWEFQLKDGVISVVAPDIRYNKPAVDVSRLTWEVKKDSRFRNTSKVKEDLQSYITYGTLKKAAANVDLVRETGRHQTELFVQNWLARSFADGKNYPVKVRFRSEKLAKPNVLPPNGG